MRVHGPSPDLPWGGRRRSLGRDLVRAAWCERLRYEGSPLRTMLGRRELCRMTGACPLVSPVCGHLTRSP
jgi:hypothetical protein